MRCPHCGGDIETDSDKSSSMATLFDAAGSNRAPRRAKHTKTSIPANWQPTGQQKRYCELQGKDPIAFREVFIDYYRSKGTTWKNWGLVWQRACREWKASIVPIVQTTRPTVQDANIEIWKKRLGAKFWSPWWGPKVGEPGCRVPRDLLSLR